MIDYLSIVETDKVNHAVETDMVKLMAEIESFGMSADELDKETGSSDGLKSKQVDLSYVHALNEPHFHEIHVVPSKHEADQYTNVKCACCECAKNKQILALPFCLGTCSDHLNRRNKLGELWDCQLGNLTAGKA
ncbi:hypothetical protein Tco_0431121 [Tanacetum coccineum]